MNNQNEFKVLLETVEKIKKFINIVNKYDEDIDISKGRYTVDAKSVIGIFTLDLTEAVKVVFFSDNSNRINKFRNDIKDFLI